MRSAFIWVTEQQGISPLTKIGGLTLLQRALLTAQRAGVQKCYLFAGEKNEQLAISVKENKGLTCEIVWLNEDHQEQVLSPEDDPDHFVFFTTDTLLQPALITEMAQRARAEEVWTVTEDKEKYTLALFPLSLLPQVFSCLKQGNNPLDLRGGGTLWGYIVKTFVLLGHFLHHLSSSYSPSQAEKDLLISLEHSRDGFTDTFFYRRLSRPLSHLVVQTSLRPNHITLLFFGIGLIGAACFLFSGYWGPVVGAILLMLAVTVDNVDGEVARIKFLESDFGEWLDNTCGTIMYIAAFLGLGVGVWERGELNKVSFLAISLLAGAIFSFPLVTWAERTKGRGGWEDKVIRAMVKSLTSHDFVVLFLLSALVGKLHWFFWGAAIGANLFWLILAWLLFRSGRPPTLRTLISLLRPPVREAEVD